jgi:hypothetical protein
VTKPPPPPQLYAIRATAAPTAVVFAHRGPWFMIALWNARNKLQSSNSLADFVPDPQPPPSRARSW